MGGFIDLAKKAIGAIVAVIGITAIKEYLEKHLKSEKDIEAEIGDKKLKIKGAQKELKDNAPKLKKSNET